MRQPPAFQCYASDELASEAFRVATLEERGLYETMKKQCWVSDTIPKAIPELAKVLGIDARDVERVFNPYAPLFQLFREDEHGRLFHPELTALKAEYQERHRERSRSGKKGAKAKWGKGKREIVEPMATPSREPMATPEKSRAEFSRGKLSKDESIEKKILLSPEHREWIDAYDKAETAGAAEYRRQSRGG